MKDMDGRIKGEHEFFSGNDVICHSPFGIEGMCMRVSVCVRVHVRVSTHAHMHGLTHVCC